MRFSERTSWTRHPNKLTLALNERRRRKLPVFDLTTSNPTECGFTYPSTEILSALQDARSMTYKPDPKGLLSTREAICGYYSELGVALDPENIILTASTSEAYGMIFKLLCDPMDNVLGPLPSYPLFDELARLHDVRLNPYRFRFDGEWHIDMRSLTDAADDCSRAILLVHPHNPTGTFAKSEEFSLLSIHAVQKKLALVVDEVFADYPLTGSGVRSYMVASEGLVFTLNGISKLAALPQLKLGWIVVSGNRSLVQESLERLELIADSMLSVSTPVQIALPTILKLSVGIRSQIIDRIRVNREVLEQRVTEEIGCSVLPFEAGWSGIIRVPRTRSDEEWAIHILENAGVYLYPGYFFDLEEDCYLVVSLLPQEYQFAASVDGVARAILAGR